MKSERGAAGLALLVIVVIIGVAVGLVLIMGPRQGIDISDAGRKVMQEEIRRNVSFGVQAQAIRGRLGAERDALVVSRVNADNGRLAAERMARKIAERERAQDAVKAKVKTLRAHYEKALADGSETVKIGGMEFSTAGLLAEMARSLAEHEQGRGEIAAGTQRREAVIGVVEALETAIDRRQQQLAAAESSLAALVARQVRVGELGQDDALAKELAKIAAAVQPGSGLDLVAKLNAELDDKLAALAAQRPRRALTDMDAALMLENAGGEFMGKIDRLLGEE